MCWNLWYEKIKKKHIEKYFDYIKLKVLVTVAVAKITVSGTDIARNGSLSVETPGKFMLGKS